MIEIIGAPFDGCGKRVGSRLGPPAIRLAELNEELEALGYEVCDAGDVPADLGPSDPKGLKNFDSMLGCAVLLKQAVSDALERGSIPLVLGGDHTLAAASVSAAANRYVDRLGLLWIDAHADINTPGSSETGNVHGMPVAALSGLPSGVKGISHTQWLSWLQALGPAQVETERIAWYGLRDVDATERPRLNGLPISMHDIDRRGVEQTATEIDRWLKETAVTHLWISFDVDVLDPVFAPGTGTAVRGGLTYREAHLFAEILREHLDTPIRAADGTL